MRHLYANRAAYLLAGLLVVATALFAWLRSEGGTLIAVDEDRVQDIEGEAWDEAAWGPLGEAVYAAECQACHATLTHIPELFAAQDGRSYLIDLMLNGYDGEMVIEGSASSVEHPRFADLDDAELAAVLNHLLVSWGNDEALPDEPDFYAPPDIEEARDRDLSPEEVAASRPSP